jgi:hypothetical protein
MLGAVALSDDLSRIAAAAAAYAAAGEEVAAVLAVEPHPSERLYLCAFTDRDGTQTWLALDDDGAPVTSRNRVRDAASIAALCEVAEETADISPETEPRVASLSYLDSLGAEAGNGNLAAAVQSALPAVDELATDVEGNYKLELTS